MKQLRVVYWFGAASLLAGAAFGVAAFVREESSAQTVGVACDNPCQGYAYEVLYDEADGSLDAALGWDASGPNSVKPGKAFNARPGQAVVVVTGNELVAELLDSPLENYYVDISTKELKEKPTASGGPSIASPSTSTLVHVSWIPAYLLGLGVILSAVALVVGRRGRQG